MPTVMESLHTLARDRKDGFGAEALHLAFQPSSEVGIAMCDEDTTAYILGENEYSTATIKREDPEVDWSKYSAAD